VFEGDVQQLLLHLPSAEVAKATELAQRAAQGDLQAALWLARLAAECPEPGQRKALSQHIREISHAEAQQVALLYLLSELAKRPSLGLEVVLREIESPQWPLPSTHETSSEPPLRAQILQRLKASGELDQALCLPLSGDEWYSLWPELSADPALLAQHVLKLPVSLACQALQELQRGGQLPDPLQSLADSLPDDPSLLGWATPARSSTLPSQPIPFEKYLSDAPYCDGSDGTLETDLWKIRFDENAVTVARASGQLVLEIPFQKAHDAADHPGLAEHDRFFDELSSSRTLTHKASSLALSADGHRLALATLDGRVRIFDLNRAQEEREVFPPGPIAPEAVPVRLRYAQAGPLLAGVHRGGYFVCHEAEPPTTLEGLRPDLRGLFFRGRALWSVFRDGSVLRLDPLQAEIYPDHGPCGVVPALSPDRRLLASFEGGQVRLFQLEDSGLSLLSQWPAPQPVRMHFALQGQALILRIPDPHKGGPRTALSEVGWRMGHQCVSDMGQEELAHYQTQAWLHPHPIWDFLTRLAEARLARPRTANS
jgi:hypothetical protein